MVTKSKSISDLIDDLVKTADELLMAANILMVLEGDEAKPRPQSILERILGVVESTTTSWPNAWTIPSQTWQPAIPIITADHAWTSISSGTATDTNITWTDWGNAIGDGKYHGTGKFRAGLVPGSVGL